MNRSEIENKVKEIIIEHFQLNVKPQEMDAHAEGFLDELGLNSIDALELLLRIEEIFSMEFADEDLNADLFTSIAIIADYIEKAKKDEE